ncbi:MAG: S41 family peptidase [Euryarchaeota archaeon]|nr:S41 family peptidase [Euryarchaeota archaeon]
MEDKETYTIHNTLNGTICVVDNEVKNFIESRKLQTNMRNYITILVIQVTILIVLTSACIEESSRTVESARVGLLANADIKIDGLSEDWKTTNPIYEDTEKSMYAVIDDKHLVLRMDFIRLDSDRETYFLGFDINLDESADYKIKCNTWDNIHLFKKEGTEWKEVDVEAKGAVSQQTVEIKVPLSLLGKELFLTGWVHDSSVKNITSHFPWIRSLKQETDFDSELTRSEWKEDFEALCYIIEYNYPYIWVKERTHGYNWLDLKDKYMQRLDEIETNEEFLSLMRKAVATLQNGHTGLLDPEWVKNWDFGEGTKEAYMYWGEAWSYSCPEVFFSCIGGEYIAVDGLGNWKEKYGIEEGAKVIEVNEKNVDDAVDSVKTDTRVWHDCDRGKLFMRYLDPTVFGENTTFTIKKSDGAEVKKTIECVSKDPYEVYFQNNKPNVEFKKWEDKKIAYMKVRSFGRNREKDRSRLLEFYNTIEGYKALIIDIRGNGGGDNTYWPNNIVHPLTNKDINAGFFFAPRQGRLANKTRQGTKVLLKSYVSTPPEVKTGNFSSIRVTKRSFSKAAAETPFDGDIYLLVDRWVYSASENFASFAKESGFATLVGTTTGGDGISTGPTSFVLPNSKLIVAAADSMGINPDGTANEETHTAPDIYVEREYGGGDEMLEYVLQLIEN